NTNARRSQLFELIKESAEKAGFAVEDAGDVNWGTRLGDGTYDASLFGWALSTTAVTESDSYYRKGALNNYSGYDNPDLTKTLDKMLVTIAPDEQAELAAEVEKQLVDDAVGLPLFQHPSLTIYGDKVSNVSTTTLDPSIFWNYWEWETEEIDLSPRQGCGRGEDAPLPGRCAAQQSPPPRDEADGAQGRCAHGAS